MKYCVRTLFGILRAAREKMVSRAGSAGKKTILVQDDYAKGRRKKEKGKRNRRESGTGRRRMQYEKR